MQTLKEQIEAFNEETKRRSNEFFSKVVAFIFEKYPFIESFSWTQYTPYFNDGDVCKFRANTDWFRLTTKKGLEIESPHEAKDCAKKAKAAPATNIELLSQIQIAEENKKKAVAQENYTEAARLKIQIESLKSQIVDPQMQIEADSIALAYSAIGELLKAFDENSLKSLFGDHAHIIVKQDKIVVEQYKHE